MTCKEIRCKNVPLVIFPLAMLMPAVIVTPARWRLASRFSLKATCTISAKQDGEPILKPASVTISKTGANAPTEDSVMNRNDGLKVCVENGVLIMQMGVEALAKAVQLNPELTMPDDKGGWIEPEIIDADKFAAEIMVALKNEDEDGTTLIHIAIDTAAMNAIENGAEGIKIPEIAD